MLRQRIVTALALIPLVVGAILYLSSEALLVLLAAVVVLGGWEWARLAGLGGGGAWAYGLLLGGGTFFLEPWLRPVSAWFLVLVCLWWAYALHLVWRHERGAPPHSNAAKRFMGPWVLIPAALALDWLHRADPRLVLYLMILIWIADSGAYFVGRALGRHKLAPRTSPGKSWEGAVGGLAGAALWAWGAALVFLPGGDPWPFVVISLLVVSMSILGDLLESLMKREAGVKDSSQLLPGHGGVLDRIDSLTAAAPWFALGWMMVGRGG